MAFKWVEIIYLSELFFYVGFFIWDVIKHNYLIVNGLWFFILPFFYYTLWLPWGIDMTDEGYNLALSWYGSSLSMMDIFYYSTEGGYLIMHYWLKLLGHPYLLWYRIGSAIIWAFFVWIVANLFSHNFLFRGFTIVFFVILSSMAVWLNRLYNFIIPYNLFPVLFFAVSLFFIFKKDDKLLILSGLFLIWSFFARFSFIVFVFLFPIFFYKSFRKVLYFVVGYFIGLILFIFLGGNLRMFFSAIWHTLSGVYSYGLCILTDKSHSFVSIFHSYIKDFAVVFFIVVILLIFKIISRWIKGLWMQLLAVVFIAILLSKSSISDYLIVLSVYAYLSLYGIYLIIKKKQVFNIFLVFVLLLLLLISFFGTNTGLKSILFNGSFLVFIGFLGKVLSDEKSFLRWAVILSSFLLLFTIYGKLNYVYRDYSYSHLTKEFSLSNLKGIYTTKRKVYLIERMVNVMNLYSIDNQYIVVNKPLLLTVISEHRPYSICWSVSADSFKRIKPAFVIFSKISLRSYDWDKNRRSFFELERKNLEAILNILRNDYISVDNIDDRIIFYKRISKM